MSTHTQTCHPFNVANDAFLDPVRLQAMMKEDGYLFFRGLGPTKKILDLRRQMLELSATAGWVDSKTDLMEGKWSGVGPYAESEPPYMEVYRRIINLPLFNELPQDPIYMDLMARILGGPVFNHRMHIGRVSFPNNTLQTTPAHQDFHYIAGTTETYTIWTPLGETPIELGGLAVLRGSNHAGFMEHVFFPGQKYAAFGLTEENQFKAGVEWQTDAFHPGDFLVFHSHTIHKAMPNVTGDHLRLSMDNRYQLKTDVMGPNAHRTHHDL